MKAKGYGILIDLLAQSAQQIKNLSVKIQNECNSVLVALDSDISNKIKTHNDDVTQEQLQKLNMIHSLLGYIRIEADKMQMEIDNMTNEKSQQSK